MSRASRTAVVVGHTSGIGAALCRRLAETSRVVGLSRRTGHDISTPEGRRAVVSACGIADMLASQAEGVNLADEECRGADLLVLNAHSGFAQVHLLYDIAEKWRDDASKAVLCIGSRAPDWRHPRPEPYAVEKAALDAAVIQLQLGARWRLMHLRPGYVDTPRVAHVEAQKLHVTHVVDAAMWMIDKPAHVLVGRVDIAPR